MRKYFEYLDDLRESGVLRVTQFPDHIMREFLIPSSQAYDIVAEWLKIGFFRSGTQLSQAEVTAHLLKLIRANDRMGVTNLYKLIKQELPDIPDNMLAKAYLFLYKRVVKAWKEFNDTMSFWT